LRTSLAADPESQPPYGPWRFEASITPVIGQLNDVWTRHLGVGGQLAIALSPRMRVIMGGLWNHRQEDRGFELKLSLGLERAGSGPDGTELRLFVPSGVYAGTEFALVEGQIAPLRVAHRLEFTFSGLAGVLETRVQLKPANQRPDGSISPATTGDTGLRPTIGVGAGLHFEFLERFSVRLEVRHFALTSRTTSVNGCDRNDLSSMDTALRGGRTVAEARVAPECRVDTFDGTDPVTGLKRSNDLPLAFGLVRNPYAVFSSYLVAQTSVGVTF